MNNFYYPDLNPDDDCIDIDGAEARHMLSARRLKIGDPILLFNGLGLLGRGEITLSQKQSVRISINQCEQLSLPSPKIILASALPKGDRLNILFDMATQLGMSEFVPLLCQRSIVKSLGNKHRRFNNICINACKQSGHYFIPKIKQPSSLVDILEKFCRARTKILFADPSGQLLDDTITLGSLDELVLLVGPEGGFSDEELALIAQKGGSAIKLASNILRIETACGALLSQINHRQIKQNGLL